MSVKQKVLTSRGWLTDEIKKTEIITILINDDAESAGFCYIL